MNLSPFLLLAYLIPAVAGAKHSIIDTVRGSQFTALLSLFNATGYIPSNLFWTSLAEDGRFTDAYCSESGIRCNKSGFVVGVDLVGKQLSGSIPSGIDGLVELRSLNAKDNYLSGTLPSSLLGMTTLEILNLGNNELEGELPDISSLVSLRRLLLGRNAFSGTISSGICKLTRLQVMELSLCTKLFGTLPSCLGDLADLAVLKITDIGLTGVIPQELCGRAMNELDPNPFGCAAIGCAAGYYHRGVGRQSLEGGPCSPCTGPSNVIASTSCQWVSRDGSIVSNQDNSPSPSMAPSDYPSVSPSRNDEEQTTIMPSLRSTQSSLRSMQPTNLHINASLPPRSVAPISDIFLDASDEDKAPSTRGLIGGTVTAGACVLIFVLFILSRQGPPKYFVRADDEDEPDRTPTRTERENRPRRPQSLVLPTLRSPASLSTIEEEDSAMVSRSDSFETLPKTPATVHPEPSSPPNLRDVRGPKRVRFSLPMASDFLQMQPEHGSCINSHNEQMPVSGKSIGDVDRWAKWILNPTLDLCSSTAAKEVDPEDDRSWHSQDMASVNSETPMLTQAESECSSASSVSLRVLGIEKDHGHDVGRRDTSADKIAPPLGITSRAARDSLAPRHPIPEKLIASSQPKPTNGRRLGMAEI